MNNRVNAIAITLLLLLILPVIATESYGSSTDIVSSDDGTLTLKTTEGSIITLFDNRNNVTVWTNDIHGNIWSAAVSPDNKYIAVGSGGGLIWLFDQKGTVVWNKTFGNSGIKSIEFSEDSRFLDASSFMNQAFYISLQGDPAMRPASPVVSKSTLPISTETAPQVQLPLEVSLAGVQSLFQSSLILVVGFIAVLCIIGIAWYSGSRSRYRKREAIGSVKNVITLKNFTMLSLLLVAAGGVLVLYYPADYGAISKTLIGTGIGCFLIAYIIFTVKLWGYNDKLLAVLMLVIPLGLYYFSTTRINESSNPVLNILIIIVTYGVIAGIFLFISDKIQDCLFSGRAGYYKPDTSYVLPGIIAVSLIIVGMGTPAVLSENSGNLLKSTTDASSGSQYTDSVPTIQAASILNLFAVNMTEYETGLTSRSFRYVVQGKTGSIHMDLYSGVFSKISSKPTPAACTRYNSDSSPCTTEEIRQYYLKFIDEPDQKKYLDTLVQAIESQTSNKDDQARIAISLVQQIPYDYVRMNSFSFKMRTPYETLYENKGVCSEKSVLLAYLLRELGYGVVLFEFAPENHMAVGIKSPDEYDFKNTGFSFIETATPSIPTDDQGDYLGAGKLTSTPQILQISDGSSFSSISEEFQDAVAFNQFAKGSTLSPEKYRQWEILMWKYGMATSDGTAIRDDPSDKPLCDNDGILCNGECYEKCGSHRIGKCTPTGVTCEGDPNNCPSGQISCNGECWQMCYGSSQQCTPGGLVCYY